MSGKAFSNSRLKRMTEILQRHVTNEQVPGLVALVCRNDEVHVNAIGVKTVDSHDSIRRDTIFRIASMTKPIAAVAAMIMVEECRLRLDDPVDVLLPELANRQVLRQINGPLDDTVPANRPITARDILTMRMGLGYIINREARTYPIMQAANELDLLIGPPRPQKQPSPDEWIRRVGTLPLMSQPGEKWLYDIASDILGVLVSRAADQPFETFLRERIFEPLGMKDTGFSLPTESLSRLATGYTADPTANQAYDSAGEESQWANAPAFASGGGGLVSTVDDYLAFAQMLLNNGKYGKKRILSRPSVELMTMDHLTTYQKTGNEIFFGANGGWGFGVLVDNKREDISNSPGRYGWNGGLGTSWANDPNENFIGILMTQRSMASPRPPSVFTDFWTSAYQAIND